MTDELKQQNLELTRHNMELRDRVTELERELATKDDTIVDSLMKRIELMRELAEARKNEYRYKYLRSRATQNTAYDIYGDGGAWRTGFFSDDSDKTFDEAIDAAMRQEGE